MKPELRSTCLTLRSSEMDAQFVQLIVDEVPEAEEISVEEEQRGVWLLKGHADGTHSLAILLS